MTTQSPLSGPMTVGDLLDRAFRLYRAHFGLFLLTAAIFLVPAAVISSVSLFPFVGSSFPFLVQVAFNYLLNEQPLSVTDYLVVLVLVIAYGFVTLALTVQSIEALHGRPLTVGANIYRSTRRLWSYMGMVILKWPTVLAAAAIALISVFMGFLILDALVFYGLRAGHYEVSRITVIGMEIAFYFGITVLFAISLAPFFYLLSRWLVSPGALIAEGMGPISSLRRSWHLSAGNVRRIAGYVLLLGLLLVILPAVTEGALAWIFALIVPTGATALLLHLPAVLSSLFSIVSTPFGVGAVVLLYYDLRIRNEDYDLELRLDEMEEQVSRDTGERAP